MKTMIDKKEKALASFLGIKLKEVRQAGFGESTFEADGAEYLVLTDEEANEAATEYIKDSLWAFKASFILEQCGLDFSGEESLRHMQEKACEDANDFFLSLVEKTCGLDEFVEVAISADGRGHFLSRYDGEENKKDGFYIYRTN